MSGCANGIKSNYIYFREYNIFCLMINDYSQNWQIFDVLFENIPKYTFCFRRGNITFKAQSCF